MFIAIWIVCGIIAAIIFSEKGKGSCSGFVLGVLLGPIGIIIALLSDSKDETDKKEASKGGENSSYKKCPFCAESIRKAAIKCRYCQSDLPDKNNNDPDLDHINNRN